MVKIVYNTQEIILKQFSQKISTIFPYDVILTSKTILFKRFEQIFEDFGLLLNYNMEITPKTHGGNWL